MAYVEQHRLERAKQLIDFCPERTGYFRRFRAALVAGPAEMIAVLTLAKRTCKRPSRVTRMRPESDRPSVTSAQLCARALFIALRKGRQVGRRYTMARLARIGPRGRRSPAVWRRTTRARANRQSIRSSLRAVACGDTGE
jgi:hypothetical protein